MIDDKLICSDEPLQPWQRAELLRFFGFYARCKAILNFVRREAGANACEGWLDARSALARARPRDDLWRGPQIPF